MRTKIQQVIAQNPAMTMRDYQVATIEETVTLLSGEYNSVMIESPTGSGKTIMGMVSAIMLMGPGMTRIGWSAGRSNLLSQAREVARMFGLGDENFFTISMFDKDPPKVDILVVDEAHHDATASMAAIHKKVGAKKTIGLSATPLRTDRAELLFEKSVSKAGIYELVRLGYLSRPNLFILPDWEVDTVVKTYLGDRAKWGKSIMFFYERAECEAANLALLAAGVRSQVIHAGTPDRDGVLDAFEAGEIEVLINMAILTEGFDCPSLETAFVRPTGASLTRQMGGRVLRLFPGITKKIVQSEDSPCQFGKFAPVGRSYKVNANGECTSLDYDPELMATLIARSNKHLAKNFDTMAESRNQLMTYLRQTSTKKARAFGRGAGNGGA